jgi:spermidine synthase
MFSGLCLAAEKLCEKIKNAEMNQKLNALVVGTGIGIKNEKLNILVLGTGTGILTMFIRQHFSTFLEKVTTVEIDASVLLAAKDHFGFNAEEDPLIDSLNCDAFEFVWGQSANTYDMVFFDVNYEEGEDKVSPPLKYLQPDFLAKLVEITTEEGGLVAINTIIEDAANRETVTQNVKGLASCAKFSSKMDEEKNEIIYLARGTFDSQAADRLDDAQDRKQKLG